MINENVVGDLYKQEIASLQLPLCTSVHNAETTKQLHWLPVKGKMLKINSLYLLLFSLIDKLINNNYLHVVIALVMIAMSE